jgi:hypothetical protein
MIAITISGEAYAAIALTLPTGFGQEIVADHEHLGSGPIKVLAERRIG